MNTPRFYLMVVALIVVWSLNKIPTAMGQATWIGPANGSWNNAVNWDSGDVPNSASESAIVGLPSPVQADTTIDIASLMVEADGVVDVQPNINFDFSGVEANSLTNLGIINTLNNTDFQFQGTVLNSGQFTVMSSGNFTDIEVDGATQLSGGGTITLGGNVNARLIGLNSLLTVDDQTIQGFGQIGGNTLAMELSSSTLVDANSPGNTLAIDGNASLGASGFGVVNDGIMRASNGGFLRFSNDAIDNRNGVIEALAASTVQLENATTIVGGMVRSLDDGQILQTASSDVFFEDLTVDADLQVQNNTDLGITGTINNLRTVAMNSAGNFTDIEVQADGATLTGGGTVTLAGSQNARMVGGNSSLSIEDQTVEGQGQVGANTLLMEFGENAVIDANVDGEVLTLDGNASLNPDGFGTINDGTVRASAGGILSVSNDTIDNRNGVIEALAGSTVQLSNAATIVGGIVRSLDDGLVIQPASTNVFLEDLTIDADVQVENNVDFGVTGTISNVRTITVNSAGNFSDIEVQADGATLEGGGTVSLRGSINARLMGVNSSLMVGDQTIEGRGQIGANTLLLQFGADTLVDANVSGETLALDGNANLNVDGFGTINNGTLRASNGGTLSLANDVTDNQNGVIESLAGSTVRLENGATVVGGLIRSLGDGQVAQSPNTNVFLEDLTIDADFQTGNNVDLGMTGTINNLGSISVNSTGNFTDIEIQAAGATITGPGTTTLSGANARVSGFAPLIFEEGTLAGNGQLVVDSSFDSATISPGLSVGSLRFTNSDSLLSGGTVIRHEIQSTVDNPGVSADVIDVTGQLNLNGVSIALTSLDANGDPGLIQDFNANGTHKLVVAIANEIGTTSGLSIDTSAFSNSFTGVFSITVSPRATREALIVRYGEFALADVNRDGSVNLLDVAPFIDALSGGPFSEEADVNCDGAVNLLDVDPFIGLLSGG